ncbi:hypothetical protein GWI33_009789 [Rhynchophorus ferrugineus]|uniref:Uncharacterized protein n=1 Tax=Rhynchophorus ferrugineus TaxID=354439 RepID=A0A834MKL8_RHYFE|nr:hypothetical protein GWI33_009789 [Rhynchophorus ferrugineus]
MTRRGQDPVRFSIPAGGVVVALRSLGKVYQIPVLVNRTKQNLIQGGRLPVPRTKHRTVRFCEPFFTSPEDDLCAYLLQFGAS